MELIYTPTDGEQRSWQFAPRLLRTVEAELIESVGGTLWEDFDTYLQLFDKANRRALRASLWILLRRENPKLLFDSLDIGATEIRLAIGDDEKQRIKDLLASTDLDDVQRAYFEEIIGEEVPRVAGPKDLEPND